MNWAQFKDPVSHMCLAGTVVAPWSLTQEMAGSSPFIVKTNIFVIEFSKQFSKHFSKHWRTKFNPRTPFYHVMLSNEQLDM